MNIGIDELDSGGFGLSEKFLRGKLIAEIEHKVGRVGAKQVFVLPRRSANKIANVNCARVLAVTGREHVTGDEGSG